VLSWFRVVKLELDVRGATLTPPRPTFIWANTAYYARERAARHFGVSAQDMIVTSVGDPETFPAHAVELIETDGVVEQRLLRRSGELLARPVGKVERQLVTGIQRKLSEDIDRVIVTKLARKGRRRKKGGAKR
jgi:hypothetical protein